MSIYYVDTSALVKKYRTERGTDVVAELFGDRVGTDVLLTSYLTVLGIHIGRNQSATGKRHHKTCISGDDG